MTVKTLWAGLLCGMALALPVAAQEAPVPEELPQAEEKAPIPDAPSAKKGIEDPPLHRWGGWTLSAAGWNASIVGADEEIAAAYEGAVARPLMLGADSRLEETARVTYHLPRGGGSIVGQYDAVGQEDSTQNYTPAEFDFAETRAYPLLLGVFDDGLSDGVSSTATRTTRDVRLGFQKRAFESTWARATWEIGYRQLSHSRRLEIAYFALVPNLPPVVPPVGGSADDLARLEPRPDLVLQTSDYSGNGLGASFDVEFTIHPRVSIISGIAIGLTRGKATSSYTSTFAYYNLRETPGVPLTPEELFPYLSNPAPPSDPAGVQIEDIEQTVVATGLKGASSAQLAQSYDLYLGVQVLVYKGLRVFATLRDLSYVNVGEYVVPKPGPSTERTSLNAGYEGAAVGLSWRF